MFCSLNLFTILIFIIASEITVYLSGNSDITCASSATWKQQTGYQEYYDGNGETCKTLPADKKTIRFMFNLDKRVSSVVIRGRNLACELQPNGLQVNLQPPEGCSKHCAVTWCVARKLHKENGLSVCAYHCEPANVHNAVHLHYTQNFEICEVTIV